MTHVAEQVPDCLEPVTDVVDDQTRTQLLRTLITSFVGLTAAIAVIGLLMGRHQQAAISAAGFAGFGLLLLGLGRWGSRRTGYLCLTFYFVLAAGAMAAGLGVRDATIVLFPAGMFLGALILERKQVIPMIVLAVATTTGIGVLKLETRAGLDAASAQEVIVVSLLLVVAGILANVLVHGMQKTIAERRHAEATALASKKELEAHNESLAILNELAHLLQVSTDEETMSREAVDVLVRHHEPQIVDFYLLDERGAEMHLVADHGFNEEERSLGAVLPVDGSLAGLALREQKVVYCDDLEHDPRVFRPVAVELAKRGIGMVVAIPLVNDGRGFGVVNMVFTERRPFTPLELDTFAAIGQTVALAIANARHLASLEYLAFHDPLTNLPNRASLHRRFQALVSAGDGGERMALVLCDLNRFREINEALGYEVGDELLVLTRLRLEGVVGRNGEIFRLGGDEFIVLVPGLERVEQGEEAALRILERLRHPFQVGGMSIDVGASAGVAIYPDHARESPGLLRCADVATYHAKRSAGGVASYSPEFDEHTPERLLMISELGRAIREGSIDVHFQPKFALAAGSIVGFEALVRWPHATGGMLVPANFISVAETNNLVDPLTYLVVEKALLQLREWNRSHPGLTMSVNLSVRNLLDRNCSQRIEEIIRRVGVDPNLVEFELTETAIMTDPESALAMLGRITATGARLAIDDFGTGYSSLTYLKRFPVSAIKIDRSFVQDMGRGGQNFAIVRATVQLAKSLGLTVVAEGIEDRETADALREFGCDHAQGYYFARPAPAAEAGRHLTAGNLIF